jgi:hypothetical protein
MPVVSGLGGEATFVNDDPMSLSSAELNQLANDFN